MSSYYFAREWWLYMYGGDHGSTERAQLARRVCINLQQASSKIAIGNLTNVFESSM